MLITQFRGSMASFKKKTAVFLLALCILSVFPIAGKAGNTPLIANGTFNNGLTGWAKSSLGSVTIADTGTNPYLSVSGTAEDKNPFAAQSVSSIAAGGKYILSAKVRSTSLSGSFGFELEYYNSDGQMISEGVEKVSETNNAWKDVSYVFIAPEGCVRLYIHLRLYGAGTVCFDDVEFVPYAAAPGKVPAVVNGTFDNGLTGWSKSSLGSVAIANTGENPYLSVSGTAEDKDPFAVQGISPIAAGGKYILLAKVSSNALSGSFGFELEYYDSDGKMIGEDVEKISATNNVWKDVSNVFIAPEGCVRLYVYLRLYGAGTVSFDDVEFRPFEGEIPPFFMIPETAFYYTENITGSVRIRPNKVVDTVPQTAKIKFEILDGEQCLYTDEKTWSNKESSFDFPVNKLETIGRMYTIRARLTLQDKELFLAEDTVYRYNRPTVLQPDGTFFKDGKTVHPVIGYHCPRKDFGRIAEMGVNVIQLNCASWESGLLLTVIEEAWKEGLYVLLELYKDMKPAAHPDNKKRTEEIVKATMNHEAVFGYMLMDEPMANTARFGGVENTYKLLKDSYTCIRNIDPVHPIYVVECYVGGLEMSGACADVFAVDMYPSFREDMPTHIIKTTRQAIEAVSGKKPVYHILLAYNYSGKYEPSSADVRHMIYQAFFAGAKGFGYYPISDTDSTIWENELYNGVVSFSVEEKDLVFEAFAGRMAGVEKKVTDTVSSIQFSKENVTYVIAINHTSSQQSFSAKVGSMPIRLLGEQMKYVRSGDTISVNIPPAGIFACSVGDAPAVWAATDAGTTINKYQEGKVYLHAAGLSETDIAYFALYQTYPSRSLVSLVHPEEGSMTLPAGQYELKGFVWDRNLKPKCMYVIE